MKEKKNYTVFSNKDVIEVGRATTGVRPHADIVVQPPPESSISIPGAKCEHGVYIPATAVSSDHAPYCSLCYPYLLELKS